MLFLQRMVLLLVTILSSRAAGLTFEKDLARLEVGPDTPVVTATFDFRNTSSRDIRITAIKASCGCVATKAAETRYGPGAKGTISAAVTINDMTGPQEKFVQVYTDEPDREEPYELELLLNVKAYVKVAPQALFWTRGEEPSEKNILCEALQANAISVTQVHTKSPDYEVRVEIVEAGRQYRLQVKPRTTALVHSGRIDLQLSIAGAPPRSYTFEVGVSPE